MRSKPISYTTNLWILPLLMAIFSLSLQAQQPGKDSWDNLNRLQAGQKIQLVQMDLKSLKGQFLGFTDEMISLRVKKDEVAVPREDVFRVSFRGKPKRGQNALLMMGVGAGLGAISGAAVGAGFHEVGETGVFKGEIFFPKEFNQAQIDIIRLLETSDGVVVQGPPGTGKTHTIANIICHFLATGRRVLVTSQGEPALNVLREFIPEEIRSLIISLLTKEREGLEQLETAVTLLANEVSRINPSQIEKSILEKEREVRELREQLSAIEREVREWAEKQLTRLITDVSASQSAKQADIVFRCRCRIPSLSDSYTSVTSLLNYLVSATAFSLGAGARERLERIDDFHGRLDDLVVPSS